MWEVRSKTNDLDLDELKSYTLLSTGGPVGTLIAAQLCRFQCSVITIEREDKKRVPVYGRATTMWSVSGLYK